MAWKTSPGLPHFRRVVLKLRNEQILTFGVEGGFLDRRAGCLNRDTLDPQYQTFKLFGVHTA